MLHPHFQGTEPPGIPGRFSPPWCDGRYVADPILSCSGCLLGGAAGPEPSWSSTFDETAAYLGVAA
ncbi:MAG TPA: hypothetical protein VF065_05025, partial [Ilumatobacter sp.]